MSSCSTPPTAAGSLRATSGRSPCRSTSPSNSSAPIRTSWNSARPTAARRHTARQRSTPDPLPCKLQFLDILVKERDADHALLGRVDILAVDLEVLLGGLAGLPRQGTL